ncbi:MAG: adenylosuccinate synthase [Planctomycetes bacterium]|nr:adenylosuccinate synthase [Planctomycetota bacterium]
MPVTCVVGAQWGDEGKARIVDLLSGDADLVVRYQGGANTGHTVVVNGKTVKLHLIPVGVLREGCVSVVGNGCVLDLKVLFEELEMLARSGYPVDPARLRVSDRAHLVLPYHRALDAAYESARGAGRIGTTGRGIGPCYSDKVAYKGIRVCDLFDDPSLEARVLSNCEEKNRHLGALGAPPVDAAAALADLRASRDRVAPFVEDTAAFLRDAIAAGSRLLCEGAQAVLLDVDHGTYPYVSASNASVLGVPAGSGIPPRAITRIVCVAKAYATRVGEGPFPSEETGAEGQRIRERGREFGTTTGRPRRCGWFDAVAARYSVSLCDADEIALTKLDILAGMERLRICTAYDIGGRRVDRLPADVGSLRAAKPVWKDFPGFEGDLSGCRNIADLPAGARAFVDAIEREAGAPVRLVSVGADRAQYLTR